MTVVFCAIGLIALAALTISIAVFGVKVLRWALRHTFKETLTEQETRFADDDDPLVDVLHRALANRTGKLRVSDAFMICGIEPGKVNEDQISRFGRAIRELGWERQRRRLDGSLQYAYVRGTTAEREVELVVEYDPHLRSVRIDNLPSPQIERISSPPVNKQDVNKQDTHRQDVNNSVADYLSSLVWDGTPRLDRWLIDYAGADDTPYVRKVSRWALVAAVHRVRRPGCRLDQTLVLEGPQGCGKSRALRILTVKDDWFTDDLPLHGDTRRLMEATAGKWIVVAGELKGLGRNEVAALKTWLSRQSDEARMAYDTKVTRTPRQFVVIGTANGAKHFNDTNLRRFCPVSVQHFNLDKLREDRDQLWAEAAVAEALGSDRGINPLSYEWTTAAQETGLSDTQDLDIKHSVKT